jgi:hypothetical protein
MDQVSIVLEPVKYFTSQIAYFLPRLLLAAVVLVAGWLIAKLLYSGSVRALNMVNINALTEKAGINRFLVQGGIKRTPVEIIGVMMYWVVILVTLLVASNVLGLAVVSDLFSDMLQFIPKVIVAVLILTIGLYFARFISDIVYAYGVNIGFEDAEMIGRITRYAIVAFVIVIALGQVNIGNAILVPAFLILFGGVVLAFALAFGLGGREWAASQLAKFTATAGKGKRKSADKGD